jgi:DNA-binding NtrC family response regulator
MIAPVEPSEAFTESRTVRPVKRKILLVNDDPAMRRVLFRLLAEEDFLVLTAANGVEALGLVKIARFDLVLLDLKTPVRDNWETFERLSALKPRLPIILITDQPNQFFHALASGIIAVLEKPLNFTRLFHAIRDLLAEQAEDESLAHFTERPAGFYYTPSRKITSQKVWRAH